jgi:fermentation-respiration switch protein FrsA (DUF1100 family)
MDDHISRRVTFTSAGETLAGTLFTPSNPAAGRLAAVVVAGGQTCVKEQMAGVYAARLADRGYAALAFDFRGFGESTGEPRDHESPPRKIEDIRSALTFMAGEPAVDPDRLAALGIGVGAGYVAAVAAADGRVRALALVVPAMQDRAMIEARYGGADAVAAHVARGEAARRKYEQTGEVDYEPVVGPADPAPMTGYFLDPDRGGVPRWSNRFAVLSWPGWLAFDSISAAPGITAPTLMIHSENATLPEGARRFFARLAAPKTERWTGGVQFDFYDRDSHVTPAVDAIVEHLDGVWGDGQVPRPRPPGPRPGAPPA